jgi:hypothetical protein
MKKRVRPPWQRKDDFVLDDAAFELLLEQWQAGVEAGAGAAQESSGGQMSFEDAYIALLDTENNLKTAFKMMEEVNQEMRKIIGDFEKQVNRRRAAIDGKQ